MTQLARQTRRTINHIATIQIDLTPPTKTDPRNKGISKENFERFDNASDKALKRNIDSNRAAYDRYVNRDADKCSALMPIILTAIAILKSRGVDYDGLHTGTPVNPATCAHEDHDCYGQCYTCGGYTKAGDVSHFMP